MTALLAEAPSVVESCADRLVRRDRKIRADQADFYEELADLDASGEYEGEGDRALLRSCGTGSGSPAAKPRVAWPSPAGCAIIPTSPPHSPAATELRRALSHIIEAAGRTPPELPEA